MSSGVHTFFTRCEWEEGTSSSSGWQKHWRSGRSNRRCEPPQIGPHDKGAIERLAPLTKKQYSGTWTLDKGAIERVCAAEWLRRLSEGFGQGGADRAENLLTRFFWQCELSDCWELNYSKQSPGNHRIPFKQTAESGDQQNKYKLWNLSLTWILNDESFLIISNFIIPPIQVQMQSIKLVS